MSFVLTFKWPPGAAIRPGNIGTTSNQYNWEQAFFAEFFGTFVLAFVVLSVALVRKPPGKDYIAFAIGGCIVAGGYGFAPLSGGVLNPAIALANGFVNLSVVTTLWPAMYTLAEVLGAVMAAVVFRFLTHPQEYFEGTLTDANVGLIPPVESVVRRG